MQLRFFLFILLLLPLGAFSQDKKILKRQINVLKKHDCALLFYHPHFDKGKENIVKEKEFLNELRFLTLDSLLQTENAQVKVYVFFVMCTKYRSEITEKHLKMLSTNEQVSICSGKIPEKVGLQELTTYLYKNSVLRKEKITNEGVTKLLFSADSCQYHGPVNFSLMISLLQKADSLEPKNPIVLEELGRAKYNSKIDVWGGVKDMENSLEYSLDEREIERRTHNLGITYMELCDIQKACFYWGKSGEMAAHYVEKYCSKEVNSTVFENQDQNLSLKLSLENDTTFILDSHNGAEMSPCKALLEIKNTNHSPIYLTEKDLDYGLEGQKGTIYLEAINEAGQKWHFFTETEYYSYGSETLDELKLGTSVQKELDLTYLHHFPYAGVYQIRVALRPSSNVKGLTKTYYSNWQKLTVVQNYQPKSDELEWFEEGGEEK